MPGKIFVNYRRAESDKDARHLATLLDKGPFRGRVFIDRKGLDGTPDWLHELERQVAASEVMVSVICRNWADVKGPDGKRRIDSDRDFVRFELAQAFHRGIPVIPVLVDDARMPRGAELPDNLLYLTRPQAEFLRQETFEADVEKIARRIGEDIRARRRGSVPAWVVAAAAGGALLAGAAAGIVGGPRVAERLGWKSPEPPSDAQSAARIEQLSRELAEADATVRSIQAGRLRVEEELKQAKDEAAKATAARDAARQQGDALGKLAESRGRELAAAKAEGDATSQRLTGLLAAAEKARVEAVARLKDLEAKLAQLEVKGGSAQAMAGLLTPPLSPVAVRSADVARSGESFRDCHDCPEMVVVPPASFTMGSPSNETGRNSDEGPQRTVTIRQSFAVGKFEVTFAEWEACVAGGGCKHKPPDQNWGRGRRPVINVSWDDAKQYVTWLSRKTGKAYRLLTEAEWEYAARAGTTTPFSTGATITPAQANFNGNSTYGSSAKGQYRQQTIEVGSFPANAFGLHDMHGNVWEWVEDCYADTYNGAPSDGTARTTACTEGSRRVLRGGSWNYFPVGLRSAVRYRNTTDNRDNDLGFRLGRTLTP